MNQTRLVIHGAFLLAFACGSLSGLSGCGESSQTTGETIKVDEAKIKAANEATAAANAETSKAKKK